SGRAKTLESKIENEESHSSRRWRGNTSLSADENRLQTAVADLRQADDLLPVGDLDAWRAARGAHHLNTERSANAGGLPRRRLATRHSYRIRSSTEARRYRASFFDRRKLCRRLRRIAHSWRQHFLRQTRLLP